MKVGEGVIPSTTPTTACQLSFCVLSLTPIPQNLPPLPNSRQALHKRSRACALPIYNLPSLRTCFPVSLSCRTHRSTYWLVRAPSSRTPLRNSFTRPEASNKAEGVLLIPTAPITKHNMAQMDSCQPLQCFCQLCLLTWHNLHPIS